MAQRKGKLQLTVVGGDDNDENGVRVSQRKSVEPVDHWAFLDEIEAPMWFDLNSETVSCYQNEDDEWFNASHPFHQHSSRHLISAFCRSGESGTTLDFELEGPSSPKLPSSVSRSRGKHYRSRVWGGNKSKVTTNKHHPVKNLSSKPSRGNLGSGCKLKIKPILKNTKANSGPKENLVYKTNLSSGSTSSKPLSSVGDPGGESKATSTSTSESVTSGLLSTLKITLRKSCATRPASRGEFFDGRKSEGSKSSSGKSSVGSSRNPGSDRRSVLRISQAINDTVRVPNLIQAPRAKVPVMTTKSRLKSKATAANSAFPVAAKLKVQCENVHSSLRGDNNKQHPITGVRKGKEKIEVSSRSKKLVAGGKENPTGNRQPGTKNNVAKGKAQVPKVKKQNIIQKSERRRLIGPKEKLNEQKEEKKTVHLR